MVNHIGEIANIGWGIGSVRGFAHILVLPDQKFTRDGGLKWVQWAFVSSRFDKYARMQYITLFFEIKGKYPTVGEAHDEKDVLAAACTAAFPLLPVRWDR